MWGEESYTDRWAFLYRNEREPVLLRLRTSIGPTTKLYSFIPLCSSASEHHTRGDATEMRNERWGKKEKKETIPRDGGTVSFLRVG